MKKSRQNVQKGVQTIWQYSCQLFSVSGVNGVSHIAVAKSNGRKLLWTVIFGISLVGWFYQTTTLLEHYYTYPTIVKIEVEKEPIMQFPGVTICNMNRIRKSQYCKEFPDACASNDTIELSEEEIFELTFDFMKRGEKHILGHQVEDMVVNCAFSGTPTLDTETCLKYFLPIYDPHLGNCFVLTSEGRETLMVSEPDAWQDVKEMDLILNLEQDEYLGGGDESPSLILTIHEDRSYPDVFSHGLLVQARKTYHLAIEKVTVFLLSGPYKTNCTDFRSLPFESLVQLEPTPRLCTVECLLHIQQKECGHGYVTDNVVLFSNEIPYDPKKVNDDDVRCANKLSESFKHYCSEFCSIPCHDVHFPVSISAAPTAQHSSAHDEEIEAYRKRTRMDKRLDLTHVKIHFQSMEHRTYRHSPEYTTEIFFSYMGGITGGWLGISLLEFCAFVEGLLSVGLFSFRYCKPAKSRPRRKRGGKGTPRKMSPVFQGQCDCNCSRRDYGSLLLAMPADMGPSRTIQVVPFGYY